MMNFRQNYVSQSLFSYHFKHYIAAVSILLPVAKLKLYHIQMIISASGFSIEAIIFESTNKGISNLFYSAHTNTSFLLSHVYLSTHRSDT